MNNVFCSYRKVSYPLLHSIAIRLLFYSYCYPTVIDPLHMATYLNIQTFKAIICGSLCSEGLHGVQDGTIASTAAQVAIKVILYLLFGWLGVGLEQTAAEGP